MAYSICMVVAFGAPAAAVRAPVGRMMFPDGLVHDFGSVPAGRQCTREFRVINTTRQPVRIVVRFSNCYGSRGCVSGWATREILQPGEQGKIILTFDTSRFDQKALTARGYLHLVSDNGVFIETRILVFATVAD